MSDSVFSPVAAIDLGSNSIHLVVASYSEASGFIVHDSEKQSLRLAAALGDDQCFSQETIERVTQAFVNLKSLALGHTESIRAVATFATREAQNKHELVQSVEEKTGIRIEVIDGLEEARLEFLGVQLGLGLDNQKFLVVDVGGGSTEACIGKGGSNEFLFAESMPLGAVALTESFLNRNNFDKSFENLRHFVISNIDLVARHVKSLGFERAVMASGTAKAIAKMVCVLEEKDIPSVWHGYEISVGELKRVYKKTQDLEHVDEIVRFFDIEERRASIILAGLTIFHQFSKMSGVKKWQLSTYSLREGMVVDQLLSQGVTINGNQDDGQESLKPYKEDVLLRSSTQFANRMFLDAGFCVVVKELVQSIYSVFVSNKSSKNEDLRLLMAASTLIEVGKVFGYSKYHLHSAYMVRHAPLTGICQRERAMLGALVRAHRRSSRFINELDQEEQFVPGVENSHLKKLIGCIRLAVILNRSRRGMSRGIQEVEWVKSNDEESQDLFARTDFQVSKRGKDLNWRKRDIEILFSSESALALPVSEHLCLEDDLNQLSQLFQSRCQMRWVRDASK